MAIPLENITSIPNRLRCHVHPSVHTTVTALWKLELLVYISKSTILGQWPKPLHKSIMSLIFLDFPVIMQLCVNCSTFWCLILIVLKNVDCSSTLSLTFSGSDRRVKVWSGNVWSLIIACLIYCAVLLLPVGENKLFKASEMIVWFQVGCRSDDGALAGQWKAAAAWGVWVNRCLLFTASGVPGNINIWVLHSPLQFTTVQQLKA